MKIHFAESFTFLFSSKDSLTKETTRYTHNKQFQYLIEDWLISFQYIVIKRREKQQRKVTAHTSPHGADQHPDLNRAGRSLGNSIWSPSWEKVRITQVRLQIAVLEAPAWNPRVQLIPSSVGVQQCSSGFPSPFTLLFFTLWVTRFSRPQGVGQNSRGSKKSKPHALSYPKCLLTCW